MLPFPVGIARYSKQCMKNTVNMQHLLHPAIASYKRKFPGPVVRTSPNDLSFASTEAYKDIYGRGVGRKIFRKTEFYEQICLGFETHGIASEPNPEVAARVRKALLPIFSPHAIKDYEYHLKGWLGKFLVNVAKYGRRPGGVDMTDWFHRLFYDVAADLAFGEATGATDSGQARPVLLANTIFTLTILY